MVKRLMILFILIGIFVIGCSQLQESEFTEKPTVNEIGKDKEVNAIEKEAIRIEKIYDWNIEMIFCKECSPYKAENISQNELEEIKDEFISNFDEGEVIFDKFSGNSLFVNVTNDAEDKIRKGINLKSAEISTVYSRMIIVEEDQKEPLEDEDIYICVEDRECVGARYEYECCGCGGATTAINKAYLNYWKNKYKLKECEGVVCPAVACEYIPQDVKCVNNKCQLVSKDFLINQKCENPTDWIVYLKEETGDYYKTYLKIIEPSDVNLTEETHFIGRLNAGCEGIGTERCPLYRLNDAFLYVVDSSLKEHIGKTIEVIGKEVIIEGNKEIEIWPNKIRVCSI